MVSSSNKGSDERVPDGAFDEDVPMSEILAAIRKSIANPEAEVNPAPARETQPAAEPEAKPAQPNPNEDDDVLDLSVEVGADGQPLDVSELVAETEFDAEIARDTEVEDVAESAADSEPKTDSEPESDALVSEDEAEAKAKAEAAAEFAAELAAEQNDLRSVEAPEVDEEYEKALAALRVSAQSIEEDLVTFENTDVEDDLEAFVDQVEEEPLSDSAVEDEVEIGTGLDDDADLAVAEDGDEVVSLASLINKDEIAEYLASEPTQVVLEEEGVAGGPAGNSDDYSVSFDDDPRFAARSSDPRNRAETSPYFRNNEVDDSDPFSRNISGEEVDNRLPIDHAVPSDDERFIHASILPGRARHEVTQSPDMPDPRLTGHGVVPHEGEPTVQSTLSHAGADATSSAFEQLARGITSNILPESSSTPGGYTAVESFMAELLKPLLQDWLDEHLPEMVEKALKEELDNRLED